METINKGFTLIELLVTIAIIAVLASIVVVTFAGQREKSRDAKRKADLEGLRQAVELYYEDNGSYPETDGWIENDGKNPKNYIFHALAGKYLSNIPVDPKSGNYMYYRDDACTGGLASKYSFFAILEKPSSSDSSTIDKAYAKCNEEQERPVTTFKMNYRVGN